jgi:diguanylate cyclase (GGDEF)-like protein
MQPDRRFIWRAETSARARETAVRHACRVLIVDDDVLIRAQLCALLHGSNYEVETATSGEDALRLLRSYPCDIVITDWQMPVMDGVTLCRQVRLSEQYEHVYLLMLTVNSSAPALLEGFAAGVDDYVVKGTSSEELLARLEKGRGLARWRVTHPANDRDDKGPSLMDDATGAFNFAYFVKHLPREMARAERYSHPMTVLTCEIDSPTRINGLSTNANTDELARGFVSCSANCIRGSDWLARSGEREFTVVLPETDAKGARCVARKLSEAFARQEWPTGQDVLGATIEFDITAMDPASNGGSAAHMQALLRHRARSLHTDNRDQKCAAKAEPGQYLSDLDTGTEAERGRNWPAT